MRWIDSREHEFPALLPDGVEKVVNDEVLDEVERMPPGSHFIVMTHNHPLDLELTAAILARNDFAYFGLIGSKTKRVKFEHRLRERGVDAERLQRMRCPMGLEQVKGKLPAEIAISIAGEVIATYNAAFGLERKQGPSSVTRLTPSRAAPTNPERPRSPRPPPGGPPTNPFRDCHDPQRQSLPRRHPAQHRRPAEVGVERSYEYFEDGLLLVEDGKVARLGDAEALLGEIGDVEVFEYRDALITPASSIPTSISRRPG